MSKSSKLQAAIGGHVRESMGGGAAADLPPPPPADPRYDGVLNCRHHKQIPTRRIQPDPAQPRKHFEDEYIEFLAGDIKAHGQLQTVRVRYDEAGGHYLIISGECRWRAAMFGGIATLECVVDNEEKDEADRLEAQLAENLVRKDLTDIEKAKAFRRLIDLKGYSHRQVGDRFGLSHATVTRTLAMLDTPESVQDRVADGSLAASVAYEVSKIEDAAVQAEVAERIVAGKLTRQEAQGVVDAAMTRTAAPRARGGRPRKAEAARYAVAGGEVVVRLAEGGDRAAVERALLEALEQVRGRAAA